MIAEASYDDDQKESVEPKSLEWVSESKTWSQSVTAQERIVAALREAQSLLAAYVEPGEGDSDYTVNALLDILDDHDLIKALEELEHVAQVPNPVPPRSHQPLCKEDAPTPN